MNTRSALIILTIAKGDTADTSIEPACIYYSLSLPFNIQEQVNIMWEYDCGFKFTQMNKISMK